MLSASIWAKSSDSDRVGSITINTLGKSSCPRSSNSKYDEYIPEEVRSEYEARFAIKA
jgi:hypothetical protein